jgi:hypothetical protein
VDADDPEEPMLVVGAETVLLAYIAIADKVPSSGVPKEREERHRAMALDLLDWAVCESDRGRELMKAKAQAAHNRRGSGTITLGPLG